MPNVGDVNVRLTATTAQFNSAIDKAQQKFQKLGQTLTSVGKRLSLAVTAPLLLIGRRVLKTGIEFEQAFTGVRKTVAATERDFKILRQGVLDLSTTLPFAATEIAGVAEQAGQLGIRTSNLLEFTRVMLNVGVATNLTAKTAAIAFATIADGTDLTQDKFENFGSALVELGNRFIGNEAQFIAFTNRLVPMGNLIGLTATEILAFSAALVGTGLKLAASTSSLGTFFQALDNAARGGGKELQTFAKLAGTTGNQFRVDFAENVADSVQAVLKGLKDVADAGGNVAAVLEEVGLGDDRVSRSLIALANNQAKVTEIMQAATQAYKENVALQREADLFTATTGNRLKVLNNQFAELAIIITDDVNPFVGKFIDMTGGIVRGLKRMDLATRNFALAGVVLGAALGPGLLILTMMARILSPIRLLKFALGGIALAMLGIVILWEKLGGVVTEVAKEMAIRVRVIFRETWEKIAEDFERDVVKPIEEMAGRIQKAIRDAVSQTGLSPLLGFGDESASKETPSPSTSLPKTALPLPQEIEEVSSSLRPLQETMKAISESSRITKENIEKLGEVVQESVDAQALTDFSAGLQAIKSDLEGIKQLDEIIAGFDLSRSDVNKMTKDQYDALLRIYRQVAEKVTVINSEMGDNLDKDTEKSLKKMIGHFLDWEDEIHKNSIVPDTAEGIQVTWSEGMKGMEAITNKSLGGILVSFNAFEKGIKQLDAGEAAKFNDTFGEELQRSNIFIKKEVDNTISLGNKLRELAKEWVKDKEVLSDAFSMIKAAEDFFGGTGDTQGIGKRIEDFIAGAKEQYEKLFNQVKSITEAWKEYEKAIQRVNSTSEVLGSAFNGLQDRITATRAALIDIQVAIDTAGGLEALPPSAAIDAMEKLEELKHSLAELEDTAAIEDAFNGLADTMNGALGQMLTGVLRGTQSMKEAFRDMVRNILLSLASKALQNAITGLFAQVGRAASQKFGGSGAGGILSGMFGSGKGGSTAGGILGAALSAGIGAFAGGGFGAGGGGTGSLAGQSTFTGLSGSGGTSAAQLGFGGKAFAAGGSMSAGQLGLVGERGPELFMPKTAGTIIPNHALMSKEPTVEINIINKSSAQISNRESQDGMRRRIDIMVVDAIQRDLAQGGRGSQAIGQTFGLNRSGVRR